MALVMEYVPRTEYGLIWPLLTRIDGGIVGRGGADLTVFPCQSVSPQPPGRPSGASPSGLANDSPSRCTTAGPMDERPRVWGEHELARRLQATIAAWVSWSEIHQSWRSRAPYAT